MRKYFKNITTSLISIGILILCSEQTISQWKIVNPSPFINNTYVFYADSENCKVINERGMIISTTNSGNSWEYSFSVLPVNSINFYFFNKNHGWAINEYINYRTYDGGQTWENMGNPLLHSNWDIFFDDSLNGWSVGNSYIKSTTDGGFSWDTYNISPYPQLSFISRYDDSTLFTGGNTLYRTTNNGQTWSIIQTPDYFFCTGFVSGENNNVTVGFLLGSFSNATAILKTTDAGDSWNYVFLDESSPSITKMKLHNNLLITCGWDKVFRSTDFGETWDSTTVPVDGYPVFYNNIYFATDQIIYISGMVGSLIKSTDGGISFELVSRNLLFDNFYDMSFADSLHGYFTTSNPKIFNTTNGGKSFVEITPNNIIFPFHNIQAVSNNMAVTFSGEDVYITKDGGLNWNISPYNLSPSAIYFIDTLNGWIAYYPNLIRRTINGGETWSDIFLNDSTNYHILSISFTDELNGFFSDNNNLYKKTNGGKNWGYVSNHGFKELKFIDQNNGIGLSGGFMHYTSDGGINWIRCDSIYNLYEFDLKKGESGSVLMTLNGYHLYTSSDLGRTWKKTRVPVNEVYLLSMPDAATGLIAGSVGNIIEYHDASIPLFVETDKEKNNNFQLSQNYPNPFNPSTTILYKIPEDGNVTIKIFDILGREIKTLVNENKIAGDYRVEFNASYLPSGIYIYKIQVNGFVSAKKMVLLK